MEDDALAKALHDYEAAYAAFLQAKKDLIAALPCLSRLLAR